MGDNDEAAIFEALNNADLTPLRPTLGLGRDEPDIAPLPGEGASDPKFNRLAAEESRFAKFHRDLDKAFDGSSRGTGFAITQLGERLAGQARDATDLGRLVRQQFSSHALANDADAQKLAETAFRAFAKRNKSTDTDLAWLMGQQIGKEYRDMVASRQRAEVAARAKQMEKDPIFRARQEWREKVQQLSAEFGLDYQVVEAIMLEYQKVNAPPHPGVIDPRGVPFLQVQAPLQGIAKIINVLTAGTAGSFASAVTGIGMDGQELSTAERILEGALTVMSLASPGGGNIFSEIAQITKLGISSVRLILRATRSLAFAAASSGIGVRVLLRLISRLRNVDPAKVSALLKRIKEARAARKTLRLTDGDANLMRELDDAFREHNLPVARVVKIANPTAQAFKFLNRKQPLVLSRLLGKPWNLAKETMRKAPLQEAEDIAASIRSRIRAHWDAALPKGQKNALGACEAAYTKLDAAMKADPTLNPNSFIRKQLYDQWRTRAMKRIGKDKALVRDLKDEAGVIVGKNRLTGNWTIHVRTKGANPQTHIDFDHAIVGHDAAVKQTLRFKDARLLISTIDGGNLQFMTARENRNFIEAVRKAFKELNEAP